MIKYLTIENKKCYLSGESIIRNKIMIIANNNIIITFAKNIDDTGSW